MAKLYVKYEGQEETMVLENVVDAGIAVDFLAIRYSDGVITFTKTDKIDSFQFDPTEDPAPTENAEAQNDTPSQ